VKVKGSIPGVQGQINERSYLYRTPKLIMSSDPDDKDAPATTSTEDETQNKASFETKEDDSPPKPADEQSTKDDERPIPTGKRTKRGADRQITKDDHSPDDDDDDPDGTVSAAKLKPNAFQRASDEKMKTRRILKVTKPPVSSGTLPEAAKPTEEKEKEKAEKEGDEKTEKEETPTSAKKPKTTPFGNASGFSFASSANEQNANPFAAVSFASKAADSKNTNSASDTTKSAAPLSFAGGGFGAPVKTTTASSTPFGAGTTGFGNNKDGTTSSLGLFGRGAPLTGFGGITSSTSTQSGFGASRAIFGAAPTNSSTPTATNGGGASLGGGAASAVTLSTTEDVNNGEEGEECLLQLRCKLYKLAPKVTDNTPSTGLESAKSAGEEKATVEVAKEEEEKKEKETALDWREVGIGPVRILKSTKKVEGENEEEKGNTITTTRVVQRRETTPGGPGTKLILNVNLRKETSVNRQSDKFIQLATVESEKTPVTYLFKLKTIDESDQFLSSIKQGIAAAGSNADTPTDEKDEGEKVKDSKE